jgi:hypothetical protein
MQEFSVVTSGRLDFCCQDYHECRQSAVDNESSGTSGISASAYSATKLFVALIAEFKDDRSDGTFSFINFRIED